MNDSRDPTRHLPLAPHAFQILLALLDEDRHGYAVIKEVEARTGGKTVLGTSTVYAAIKRMVNDGLLVDVPAPPGEASAGPRRRYYRITKFGRQVARAEGARIAELHELAERSSLGAHRASAATGEGVA